jgi:ATP-binding cassette subfamily F protein 3
VKVGFLSQHADEFGSRTARTVLEAAQHATGLTPGKARALLGRFLFSGEEAEKSLDVLSGGERRRLSLAVLVASGANVLILDEPTNHLDLESREALEQALGAFEGALILVSHDRALLDAVGTRTVAFEQDDAGAAHSSEAGGRAAGKPAGSLRSYAGGWPEYVRVREDRAREAAAKPAKAAAPSERSRNSKRSAPGKTSAARDQERLEEEIEAAEAALRALEDELADPSAWAGAEASARSAARHEEARRAVEELYARLERIAG